MVKLDQLGDAVIAVEAIRMALRGCDEADCLLVISSRADALLAAEFPRATRLILPLEAMHRQMFRERQVMREKMSRVTCGTVVCLRHQRGDWDELVLAWLNGEKTYVLSGAKLGLQDVTRRSFIASKNMVRTNFQAPPPSDGDFSAELERHRQLLCSLLARDVTRAEILPGFAQIGQKKVGGDIVVTPFGSNPIRDFPFALLVFVLKEIRLFSISPIFFFGDTSQHSRLEKLLGRLTKEEIPGLQLARPSGVVDFAEAIARAEFVVTVETATAHLAAAFDRPALIVIGGGHFGEFGPWRKSDRQIWLTNRIECFGCNWQCKFPEPYCLTGIAASAVSRAFLGRPSNLLKEGHDRSIKS